MPIDSFGAGPERSSFFSSAQLNLSFFFPRVAQAAAAHAPCASGGPARSNAAFLPLPRLPTVAAFACLQSKVNPCAPRERQQHFRDVELGRHRGKRQEPKEPKRRSGRRDGGCHPVGKLLRNPLHLFSRKAESPAPFSGERFSSAARVKKGKPLKFAALYSAGGPGRNCPLRLAIRGTSQRGQTKARPPRS